MDDGDVPAAAQISQADIIERQAETIARLKKQVHKGSEYKQLTKSKLKEAAARLKEYRLRVETLLRAEETLKQQLKTEQTAHAKTKKLHKSTLIQVKAKTQAHAATQTDEKKNVTRSSQTQLSGHVDRVNKKTLVDSAAQTVNVAVDHFTSRKRGRTSTQTQMDRLVPKLSRQSPKETPEDTLTINNEPLQLLGGHSTTFLHETSAALDAELAFSDSDVESGETGETLKLNSGENSALLAFDTISSELDKKLAFSGDDETDETKQRGDSTPVKANDGAEMPLFRGIDAAVQSEIDKELESYSDEDEDVETSGKQPVKTGLVDAGESRKNAETDEKTDVLFDAIADEIDKDLETSSDEENNNKTINATPSKPTLMSIDEELDGEFAALNSDSDGEKHAGVSSSSSSSDSSDSSDSDSDDDGDDPMTGSADKTPTQTPDKITSGLVVEKECDSTTDAVVLTTPIEEEPVTTSQVSYSPIVEAESTLQPLEPLLSSEDIRETNAVVSQPSPVQEGTPDSLQSTKTVDEDEVVARVTDSPSPYRVISPKSPVSTQPAAPTTSNEEDKSAEHEASTSITSPPSELPPDSARTIDPGELPVSTGATATATNAQVSEPPAPKDTYPKRVRKADEAELNESQTSSKKAKRDEFSSKAKSTAVKTKKPVDTESKEERRRRKSLALFKQSIALSKGDEADSQYARRTLTFLANQSSRFIDTLDHVTTLCQILADSFRALKICPIEVVRGALSVFRTPRSRRLLQDSKLGLSWLVHAVLLRLLSPGESLNLSNVDECLLHLRGFLIEQRANIGDFLSTSKVHVQVTAPHVNVSHDKVFLAHSCALHTHLCRATGQLSRSRVLLFDIIRDNPDIRGLYFAGVMLEIYPEMLEREFDQQCVERTGVLKETLQHAFIVISSNAAARQELLLHQSSLTMLHRIVDAIQKPELEQVNGADMYVQKMYVQKLYDQLVVQNTDYFELAKAVEICTAVYGADLVTEMFSIERCRELYTNADIGAKTGILSVVGHIAMTVAPKTSAAQYVESVLDWLYELLSSQTIDNVSEDCFQLLVACSQVCVDLILSYSAPAGLNSRRRVLSAIVNWFDATPSDHLVALPAAFLRRLRLAVVAARP